MERRRRFLLQLCFWAAVAAIGYGVLRYVLVWLLPFLLAWAVAAAVEPTVQRLRRRMHLTRGFLAALVTILTVAVSVIFLSSCLTALWRQFSALLQQTPQLLAPLPQRFALLTERLESYRVTLPPHAAQAVNEAVVALGDALSRAAAELSAALLEGATHLLGRLPTLLLFCITTVMALFFTVSTYPQLRAFLLRQVPEGKRAMLRTVKEGALLAVAKWLRAQLVLLAVTFLQLLAGFLLLKKDYALLFAVVIALFDALPLFGAGLVLLPWAALSALLGDPVGALVLVVLYVAVWLVRSFLEPKLLGRSGGLPPLPSLIAIYLGFHAFGVVGMIAAPLLLLLVKELHDRGLWQLWK